MNHVYVYVYMAIHENICVKTYVFVISRAFAIQQVVTLSGITLKTIRKYRN